MAAAERGNRVTLCRRPAPYWRRRNLIKLIGKLPPRPVGERRGPRLLQDTIRTRDDGVYVPACVVSHTHTYTPIRKHDRSGRSRPEVLTQIRRKRGYWWMCLNSGRNHLSRCAAITDTLYSRVDSASLGRDYHPIPSRTDVFLPRSRDSPPWVVHPQHP